MRARTPLQHAGEGAGAALQVELNVEAQHVCEGVVRHAPPCRLRARHKVRVLRF